MFVFGCARGVYVPYLLTIAALVKGFGVKEAIIISMIEILVAVILGDIILRILLVLGLP